jgi:hypothetical protein
MHLEKKERTVVGDVNIPLNSSVMIGIELEPESSSFFKSAQFKLNVRHHTSRLSLITRST